MFVRVAFSTAINVNPDILIVDEALSVGDTEFQQKCLYKIREMQEKGTSILLVTHSNNIMLEYCDRGIFLKNGQIHFEGDSKDAVRAYGLDILEEEKGKASSLTYVPSKNTNYIEKINSEAEDNSDLAMEILRVDIMNSKGEKTEVFNYKENITVNVKMVVRKENPIPCFGIQLSSMEGIALWSTITKIMGIDIPPLSPGTYQFSWELKANLSGNRYIVAIGVGHIEKGEYKRIHTLPYGGHFDVKSKPNSGVGWVATEPFFHLPAVID